jgi:hypothetical protein
MNATSDMFPPQENKKHILNFKGKLVCFDLKLVDDYKLDV